MGYFLKKIIDRIQKDSIELFPEETSEATLNEISENLPKWFSGRIENEYFGENSYWMPWKKKSKENLRGISEGILNFYFSVENAGRVPEKSMEGFLEASDIFL